VYKRLVLPIIQGSIGGENTIQAHINNKHNLYKKECSYDHIILPPLDIFNKKINALSTSPITVRATQEITLKNKHYPYLLGLYGDKEKKSVHAIAIANLESICIIGSMTSTINEEEIHIALAEKVVPKAIMDNCQTVLKEIEGLLHHQGKNEPLHLRSVNLMRKHNPNIKKLLQKQANSRLDVTIHHPNIGIGCLTLIVS